MVQKWSNRVTKKSNALDLEESIFTWSDPKEIASSLKKSLPRLARGVSLPHINRL